jgi:uncharacterized protein (DUF1499 family)
MKKLVRRLSIIVLIVAVVAAVLLLTPLGERPLTALFAVGDVEPVDFTALEPSQNPNWFLVCPPRLCGTSANADSPIFDVPVDRLRSRWLEVVAAQPRVVPLVENGGGLQLDYVQRSARFRFPDIVTVRFIIIPPSRSTLALYSRAVYGKDDLGVNRERIEAWLALLAEGL